MALQRPPLTIAVDGPAASGKGTIARALGLAKTVIPVRATRGLRKRDMIHNRATPHMEVDPETYEVRADGRLLVCEPATVLPLAQRYFLF